MPRGAQIALFLGLGLAGALVGLCASVLVYGPGPLLNTEVGQRLVQSVIDASAPPAPAGLVVAEEGDPAPALNFVDREGNARTLAEFHGQPLLINFWASWCGPCVEEMPLLDRFAVEQGANGVQVLGIALDEVEAVEAFLKDFSVGFPIVFDMPGPRDSSVQLGNRRSMLPYSVLLDAQGRVRKQKIGAFDEDELVEWAVE